MQRWWRTNITFGADSLVDICFSLTSSQNSLKTQLVGQSGWKLRESSSQHLIQPIIPNKVIEWAAFTQTPHLYCPYFEDRTPHHDVIEERPQLSSKLIPDSYWSGRQQQNCLCLFFNVTCNTNHLLNLGCAFTLTGWAQRAPVMLVTVKDWREFDLLHSPARSWSLEHTMKTPGGRKTGWIGSESADQVISHHASTALKMDNKVF